jgi:hypothetical protein
VPVSFVILSLWLIFIYKGTSYEKFFSKANTTLLIIAVGAEITLSVYEIRRVEVEYIKEDSKHEEWRWDIMFFLIMNVAVDVFILAQYLYLGRFKKADAMEDAEEEEINFIISNHMKMNTRKNTHQAKSINIIEEDTSISKFGKLKKRKTLYTGRN